MPSRNSVKTFAPNQYYHVYNRGVSKQKIFISSADKHQFIKILDRHLNAENTSFKNDGTPYKKFNNDLELLCYCLMGNHFHLLMYQHDDASALSAFMRSVLTAYTMYFNKKYKHSGRLFEGVYKASLISNDEYLTHISRYIHLNPRTYRTYYYSSIAQYMGSPSPMWLRPKRVLDLFEGEDYLQFLEDYEDYAAMLDEVKHELANAA